MSGGSVVALASLCGDRRRRDAADRVPVEVAIRHPLEHLRAELLSRRQVSGSQPRLDQCFLDALMVGVGLRTTGPRGRHRSLYRRLEVFNHVSHASIIGDRQSLCQVVRGMSLTQAWRESVADSHANVA